MDDALVRAEAVDRTYGSGSAAVTAVAAATFTVGPGDRIALVGPSGSGKTTLLHLIGGLDQPTGGTIEWPGLGRVDALRPGPVAIAFQGPSLLPPLTVIENVALPILLAGGAASDALDEAQLMLDRFEIGDLADKLPEELSGGQAQRAALARALNGSPRLVLADEPTGQQDRATAGRLMDALLSTISETGAALVVATHDRSVAGRLATRWSMEDGCLSTEEVWCWN